MLSLRVSLCMVLFVATGWSAVVRAMPVFARQYEMSCNVCHAAFPRLNAFGEHFRESNMRLPNWREKTTINTNDEMLALPKSIPLALRAQAYMQARNGEEIDPVTGPTGNKSSFDFQSPYLIKLLSSAPLSDHITYYFYGIFAEKGANGETLIEDAWFSHDDIFGSGIGMQFGQFQLSDLMFPRETRMTFQDFMVYRMAGITYERGVLFTRAFGPLHIGLGAVNGNGINANFNLNSPGLRRPDKLFDNDNRKTIFGRIGAKLGPVNAGVFLLDGEQKSASGSVGQSTGTRDTDKRAYGIDVSGQVGARVYWFAQALRNEWNNFLDTAPDRRLRWPGGFVGVDYVYSDRWTYSLLYNRARAGDFAGTGTIYEGIAMNTLSLGASYYFMRNVKGIIEVNADFLKKDNDADFVGHETKENYFLVGFDAAF